MKRKTIVGISGIAAVWILINFYIYYTKPEKKPDIRPEKSEQELYEKYNYKRVLSQSERETYQELTNKQVLDQSENKLLELLSEKLVWIVKDFHDTEDRIKEKLKEETGDLKAIGWKVRRVDEQTFLVSYTYEKSSRILGWFFEVKSGGEAIRDVSSDPELMRKYNVDYREEVKRKLSEENESTPTMSKLEKFKRLAQKGTREKWIEREKQILLQKEN